MKGKGEICALVLDRSTVVGLAAGLVMLQVLIFSAGFLLGAADGVQALTPPAPPVPIRQSTPVPGEGGVRLATFAVSAMESCRGGSCGRPPEGHPQEAPLHGGSLPKPAVVVAHVSREGERPAAPKKASRPSPLALASFIVPAPQFKAGRRAPSVRTAPRFPRSAEAYAAIIREAAERHSVSPALVEAVARVESGFNPRALSHKGARGLMQVIPATGRRFGVRSDKLFDPEHNIAAGVAYLAWLSKRYGGNLDFVIAAYNAGEGAVDDHGGIPPYRETRDYVRRVRATLRSIEERGLSSLKAEAVELEKTETVGLEAAEPLAAGDQ